MVDHVPMLLRDSAYCRANYLAHSQQPSKLALRDASKDDGAGCGAVAALMGRTFQSFWHAPTRLLSVLSGVLRPSLGKHPLRREPIQLHVSYPWKTTIRTVEGMERAQNTLPHGSRRPAPTVAHEPQSSCQCSFSGMDVI